MIAWNNPGVTGALDRLIENLTRVADKILEKHPQAVNSRASVQIKAN